MTTTRSLLCIASAAFALVLPLLVVAPGFSQDKEKVSRRYPPASLDSSDLREFADQPEEVQRLIEQALALTRRDLSYQYGSADPEKGGMDCSGTVHYVLKSVGYRKVPRQANQIYEWVWKNSRFHAVVSEVSGGFEMARLKPGDLLFWRGTSDATRAPPVTHVMVYLGTIKEGKPVMFGASNGRSYAGKARNGVSVFDFGFPTPRKSASGSQARFIGYGSIPAKEKPKG